MNKENIIILLAVKFPLTIEGVLGETCAEIPVFLGLPILNDSLKQDFVDYLKTHNVKVDLSRYCGEGISKAYLLQQEFKLTGILYQIIQKI